MRAHYFSYTLISIMLTFLGIDIYLPAMPQMQAYFAVDVPALQVTLSAYLLGMAFSQLLFGPIIDHFGYRRLALIFAVLFIISSVACALAGSLTFLVAARIFQAIAAGAISLIARASLPRLYKPTELAKVFLYVAPLMSISPALAPGIGGYIAAFTSWRGVSIFLALFGVAVYFLTYHNQKLEAISKVKGRLRLFSVIKNYLSILFFPKYLAYFILMSSTYFTYFAYLADSPFIFHAMGYSEKEIGLLYIGLALSYAASTQIVRFLLKFLSFEQIIYLGVCLSLSGLVILLGLSYAIKIHFAYMIVLPMMIYCLGNAFTGPIAMPQASALFPERSGYATSLISSSGLLFASFSGFVVHLVSHGHLFNLSILMTCSSLAGVVGYWFFSKARPSDYSRKA